MPRKPPKLKTAYETLPLILSIMTRSIDPILVLSAPYTAVPSTLSLPIREPVSLASVTIGSPPSVEKLATDDKTNRARRLPIVACRPSVVPRGQDDPSICLERHFDELPTAPCQNI